MVYAGLVVGIVLCAIQAIRVARLLTASLWLASTSALLAVLLYEIGGREIAVIELSVGTGLVTVLFVFALSLIGDDATEKRTVVPKPLAGATVIVALVLLGLLIFANPQTQSPATTSTFLSFSTMLWEQRGLDVLVQIALIFAGVLGILGLLVEAKSSTRTAATITAWKRPEPDEAQDEAEREEEYA